MRETTTMNNKYYQLAALLFFFVLVPSCIAWLHRMNGNLLEVWLSGIILGNILLSPIYFIILLVLGYRLAKNEVDYKAKAIELWMILDDIDTADDLAKGDHLTYRNLVRNNHRERFNIITSDGYALYDANTGRQLTENEESSAPQKYNRTPDPWVGDHY